MTNTLKELLTEAVREILDEELSSSKTNDPMFGKAKSLDHDIAAIVGSKADIAALTQVADDDVGPHRRNSCSPWRIGEQYLIRTATMTHCGQLVDVYPNELVLVDDAWVADTGRFNEALRTGKLDEVEPFPDGPVIVGRNSVIDAAIWNHPLPREVI
jgi:hypothetical protein